MPDLEREREYLRQRVLGWSLACEEIFPGVDHGRDLRLVADAEGRLDLARVEGTDNLVQALKIALTTLLGSDVFNTRFGFDGLRAMVEETNPVLVRERIRVAVVDVLRREPRIRRVLELDLPAEPLDPSAPLDEQLARWRSLDVSVAFETVTSDQAALDLGKVVPNA